MSEENQDNQVLTKEDLAQVVDENFLAAMRGFSWRAKEAKIPDVANEDMHSFRIILALVLPADPDGKIPLNLDTIGQYTISISPFTKKEIEDHIAQQEAQNAQMAQEAEKSV